MPETLRTLKLTVEEFANRLMFRYQAEGSPLVYFDGLPAFDQFAVHFRESLTSWRPAEMKILRCGEVISLARIFQIDLKPIRTMFFGLAEVKPSDRPLDGVVFLPASWLRAGDRVEIEVVPADDTLFSRDFGAFLAHEHLTRQVRRWLELTPDSAKEALDLASELRKISSSNRSCLLFRDLY